MIMSKSYITPEKEERIRASKKVAQITWMNTKMIKTANKSGPAMSWLVMEGRKEGIYCKSMPVHIVPISSDKTHFQGKVTLWTCFKLYTSL